VSKFVGKFRKNKDYNDDYDFESKKRKTRNEHSEIKKLKNYNYDQILDMYEEDGYQKDSRKAARRIS
jgi:hypothetical protein